MIVAQTQLLWVVELWCVLGVPKTLPQNLSLVACQCFTAGPIRMMRKPLARRRPDSMPTCLLLVVGFQPIWKICVKQVNKPYMDPISHSFELFLFVKLDFCSLNFGMKIIRKKIDTTTQLQVITSTHPEFSRKPARCRCNSWESSCRRPPRNQVRKRPDYYVKGGSWGGLLYMYIHIYV